MTRCAAILGIDSGVVILCPHSADDGVMHGRPRLCATHRGWVGDRVDGDTEMTKKVLAKISVNVLRNLERQGWSGRNTDQLFTKVVGAQVDYLATRDEYRLNAARVSGLDEALTVVENELVMSRTVMENTGLMQIAKHRLARRETMTWAKVVNLLRMIRGRSLT